MDRRPPPLLPGLALVALVDLVLSLGAVAGTEAAATLATATGTGLAWLARPRRPDAAVRLPGRAVAAPLALGLAAGYAGYAAWIAAIYTAGLALGLAPPGSVGARTGPWLPVALAAFGEEPLYRERLLLALAPRVGRTGAVGLTSAAFAVAHPGAWARLGTFLVGLGLGAAALASGSLWLCVGLHAGLNAAAWLHGSAPPLSPATSAAAGWGLLLLGAAGAWRRR